MIERKNFSKPVSAESFKAPGWGSAEAWARIGREVKEKIRKEGCWSSARLQPLTRKPK